MRRIIIFLLELPFKSVDKLVQFVLFPPTAERYYRRRPISRARELMEQAQYKDYLLRKERERFRTARWEDQRQRRKLEDEIKRLKRKRS